MKELQGDIAELADNITREFDATKLPRKAGDIAWVGDMCACQELIYFAYPRDRPPVIGNGMLLFLYLTFIDADIEEKSISEYLSKPAKEWRIEGHDYSDFLLSNLDMTLLNMAWPYEAENSEDGKNNSDEKSTANNYAHFTPKQAELIEKWATVLHNEKSFEERFLSTDYLEQIIEYWGKRAKTKSSGPFELERWGVWQCDIRKKPVVIKTETNPDGTLPKKPILDCYRKNICERESVNCKIVRNKSSAKRPFGPNKAQFKAAKYLLDKGFAFPYGFEAYPVIVNAQIESEDQHKLGREIAQEVNGYFDKYDRNLVLGFW